MKLEITHLELFLSGILLLFMFKKAKKEQPDKNLPPPPTLLEELESTWVSHRSLSVTYKDYPRLAGRIVVLRPSNHIPLKKNKNRQATALPTSPIPSVSKESQNTPKEQQKELSKAKEVNSLVEQLNPLFQLLSATFLNEDLWKEVTERYGAAVTGKLKELKSILKSVGTWEWRDGNESIGYKWVGYPPENNKLIEEAYQANQNKVSILIDGQTYILDFKGMKQYPEERISRQRLVRRQITIIENQNEKKGMVIEASPSKISKKFDVFLNSQSNVSIRASQWTNTYTRTTVAIYKTKSNPKNIKDYSIQFFETTEDANTDESSPKLLCLANLSHLYIVQDSPRFFIIKEIEYSDNDKVQSFNANRVGFAFSNLEQSDSFRHLYQKITHQAVPFYPSDSEPELDQKNLTFGRDATSLTEEEYQELEKELENLITKSGDESVDSSAPVLKLHEKVSLRLSQNINLKDQKFAKSTPSITKRVSISTVPYLNVMDRLTKELETPEKHQEVMKYLNEEFHKQTELETFTEYFFQNVLGGDSKTAKVLRAINQSIIFAGVYQIKATIQTSVMTGDVKGPEGWQVVVIISDRLISISHKRRERSLGTKPNEGFWFEYILHMNFNPEMEKMISCNLRFSQLQFEDNTPTQLKDYINRVLSNGTLIVG